MVVGVRTYSPISGGTQCRDVQGTNFMHALSTIIYGFLAQNN